MSQRIFIPWAFPEVGKEALRKARTEFVVLHGPRGQFPSMRELMEGLRHCDVVLLRPDQYFPPKAMRINPNLRGIANDGVGYDNVDVTLATKLGIPVTNTPGVPAETTADLAWALLMATARMIPHAHNCVATGQWQSGGRIFMGLDVGPGGSHRRKVLGIVGFGRIGQTVMQRSRGFKMRVIAYDPLMRETIRKTRGVEYRELNELLKQSDFVTLHCPLIRETHHLIGRRELDLMKPTAILINTSRGPVIDERALVSVLGKRRIAGAGLDVYEKEPRLTPGLAKLDNVVLLPHIGSATRDTREQMAVVAVKNAVAMLRGKRPPDIVNAGVFKSPEYLRRVSDL